MIRRVFLWLPLLLPWLAASPFASPLPAQTQSPPPAVAGKQELARAKFAELADRMQRLMVTLQPSEPDDSKLLAAGLQFVQERKLLARLEQAGALLGRERWDESLLVMGSVKEDLTRLLELLQDRATDLRELLDEIARLDAFRERVDQLAKEQAAEKEASARTEALQRSLAELDAAQQQAAALLAAQRTLREQTNRLGVQATAPATAPLAEAEGKLQHAAAALAQQLAELEQQRATPAPAAGEAPPTPAAGGSDSAGKAAQAMGRAQQQLGAQQPEAALPEQDDAIAQLQRTVDAIDAMAEAARRELLALPFEEQAKRQQATERATDTLSQDMEAGEPQPDGGAAEPAPGTKRVQQAVPKQRAAAGQLQERVPAKQKQQDAKEDLEAARKELDDALAQLRQQLQDEVLRALEERFTAMLARQRELSGATRTLDATRASLAANDRLPAAIATRLDELANGERELELEAADALQLLAEDATTAVFPPLVEQLRDDLGAVQRQLAAHTSGPGVQAAQRDVEDLLELLIDALRKTIERKECGH